MKYTHKLIYIVLPLLLTSCIKEGYDKENCPGDYVIVPINPDKAEELEGAYTKIIDSNGNEHSIEAGSGNTVDLEDGNYTVVVVKDAEDDKIHLTGTTIGVTTQPDGTANDAGNPVGGYTEITAGGNGSAGQDNIRFEVPTKHQSRPLILKVNFEGENTAFIQSVAGLVDGIALSRDLNHGFEPTDGQDRHPAITAGSIAYDLLPGEEDANGYTGTHILLGIDGDGSQTLTITVTYQGGIQKTYTFDITRDMDGFHTEEVTTPWVIEVTLRLGADFQATIEDWQSGPESWMDAH